MHESTNKLAFLWGGCDSFHNAQGNANRSVLCMFCALLAMLCLFFAYVAVLGGAYQMHVCMHIAYA